MKCSLCSWIDYDSDWGGNRWLRGRTPTVCPECGKRFSGDLNCGDPIPALRLVERLKRRNENWWVKLKTWFKLKLGIKVSEDDEVSAYMEKMINKAKKVPYVDVSGNCEGYNLRFSLQNMTESIWIPVRDNERSGSL